MPPSTVKLKKKTPCSSSILEDVEESKSGWELASLRSEAWGKGLTVIGEVVSICSRSTWVGRDDLSGKHDR